MSITNRKRLPPETFRLDVERMRRGWYSDKYFLNLSQVLTALAREGYRYPHKTAARLNLGEVNNSGLEIGNIEVEMQWFTRRRPRALVVGVDKALAILQTCTGYFNDQGEWVDTHQNLEIWAVHDGTWVSYDGNPTHACPVLKARGRYRDFTMLETPTLGVLTRCTRVATNVYEVLAAANGKPVLFFPARFDTPEVQASDGYSYDIAVQAFNAANGHTLVPLVSTDAQGDWWGGAGGGTTAHAIIACFLGDTAEMMVQFASVLPVEISRIALVDFNNDCVGDTMAVMDAMFDRYLKLHRSGKRLEARKFKLFGVRPDTSGTLRDVSVEPLGVPEADLGVCPRLVVQLRSAIDSAWQRWGLQNPEEIAMAKQWCRDVAITVTGGFTPDRIQLFEREGVPVGAYGVGSWLFSNCSDHGTNADFTADVVRVKIKNEWHDIAKVGRRANDNPDLVRVQ